ncbi:4Fe-4S dicluster domain-containing protein [Alistipes sp. AF48-12]|jgi:hypothetical protein|uniref:nitroreductase family protein n=1 Tax=Alistipes sp. AF48-12 TaxID=2291998 RepID=UPI000E481D98|nr:nitroreductase family protein [Alistipes sp. AF48-12]RHO67756.1 4Fe-4S dicluster domain-containing protein [Alistipes sp. AF48-12]
MKVMLSVRAESCIRCGKCVRVCPSKIFTQPVSGGEIGLQGIGSCIVCGHCVAVCPTGSVEHGDFPPQKVHPVDRELLPSPEQVMLLCKARRSNRAFTAKPVPEETLDRILEAAHRAPTASNLQRVAFTLVTDPEKLHAISAFTVGVFASILKKLENPLLKPVLKRIAPQLYGYVPHFKRLISEFDKGNDLILRGATAVILIHTPSESRFGCQDANLAYQNGSLMAESLGVAQFYTGFVCSAVEQDRNRRLAKMLGISGKIRAGMALGIPAFRYPNYIDRKDINVTKL